MIDILEEEYGLPEVEKYRIYELWDKEEVEWLDDETIILHGLNEGRKFKVVRKQDRRDVVVIKPQVPLSPEWHKLTNWHHAEEVYVNYPAVWREWVIQSIIPWQIIERVREQYE